MFITGLSLLFCLLFGLPTAVLAANDIRGEGCGNNPERPYVCDIGAPKVLSKQEFIEVLRKNEALRETVKRLGKPDRAEIQKVRVREPWSQWEVRTYYEDLDRMFVYGRAYILGSPVITNSTRPNRTGGSGPGGPCRPECGRSSGRGCRALGGSRREDRTIGRSLG